MSAADYVALIAGVALVAELARRWWTRRHARPASLRWCKGCRCWCNATDAGWARHQDLCSQRLIC